MKRYELTIPLLFAVVFAFFLIGCYKAPPIPEEIFVNLYTDIIIAQEKMGNDPATAKEIRDSLCQVYGVTDSLYKENLKYYDENPNMFDSFYAKVHQGIQSRQKNEVKVDSVQTDKR